MTKIAIRRVAARLTLVAAITAALLGFGATAAHADTLSQPTVSSVTGSGLDSYGSGSAGATDSTSGFSNVNGFSGVNGFNQVNGFGGVNGFAASVNGF